MKKLVLLIAALAMLAAIPASAQATTVNRVVQTTCDRGVVWTLKTIDHTVRYTEVGCPNYTFFDFNKMVYVTWPRPQSDLEGAVRSARVWWPKCAIGFPYASADSYSGGFHYYFWYLHVCV